METKVTSLALSQRLDALITDKKETEFYWVKFNGVIKLLPASSVWSSKEFGRNVENLGRAFLTDEILERIKSKEITFGWNYDGEKYCYYARHTRPVWNEDDNGVDLTHGDTLPEACGMMLEYLLVNHLIKI